MGVWFSRGRGFEGGKWVGWGTFLKELSWFFMHFFKFLSWMGWFLMGSPGLNGLTAPGAGSELLGKEGGGMLSRYSHWLSRPWM